MSVQINADASLALGNIAGDIKTALGELTSNVNDPTKMAQSLQKITDGMNKQNNLAKGLSTKQRADDVARSMA
jgi:hypothetical protein